MARRRRIRWPGLVAALVLTAGVVLLVRNPEVLAPPLTRLLNRQLLADLDGDLRVGAYHFRPFAGLDVTDISLTLRSEHGGQTQVAVDTLELDFRLREVMGRSVHLQRLTAQGMRVFHIQDPASDQPRGFTLPRLTIDLAELRDVHLEVSGSDGRLREQIDDLAWHGEVRSDGERLHL